MARSGDDEGPGGEPDPDELWISGSPIGQPGPDSPVGSGPGRGDHPRGHGGSRRTRWIALAAGFAVLVAVIAVQHFAGGGPSASSSTTPSTATAPSGRTSTGTTSSLTTAASAPSTSNDSSERSGPPLSSVLARLSEQGIAVVSSQQTSGTDPLGPTESLTPSSSTAPPVDTTSPSTTRLAKGLLPGSGRWELIGYGVSGVTRYRPATGRLTVTPVPPVSSSNVLSFVVTRSAVVIRSMDNVPGYLVPDGKPAAPLTGLLGQAGRALPGPDPDQLWMVTQATSPSGPQVVLVLVDVHGKPVGPSFPLPKGLGVVGGYAVSPDGAGYALVTGLGGVYDARPDGVHLVTHGRAVAVGPTAFLVDECSDTARCSATVIDRGSGKRRALDGLTLSAPQFIGQQGVISADGRYAAVPQTSASGVTIRLIDLRTGRARTPDISRAGGALGGGSAMLGFSPNGRYLLVAGIVGVVPVDTRTGSALDPLPIPPVRSLAVRPPS